MIEIGEGDLEVDLAVAVEIEFQQSMGAVEAQMVPRPGCG